MLRTGIYLQGRYEILGLIGSGGMSDVYRAKCHKLNRLVAIKVLKEEFSNEDGFVDKFQMEAQAAARLSHPNIVNVYDVVDEGSIHYIVMELIEGITLKSYIGKKGFLDVKEAVGWLKASEPLTNRILYIEISSPRTCLFPRTER